MQEQLSTAESKLHEQAQLVEVRAAEARTDALTGLANRREFDVELAARFAEFGRSHKNFSLIISDIDHFKHFNDKFGHQAGDEVLRGAARILRESAGEGNLVARYGGEEFAVILPATNIDAAGVRLERIRRAVEEARFRVQENEFKVTMSFGVAEVLSSEELASLIHRADMALYASKENGRNRGYWHTGEETRPLAIETTSTPAAGPLEDSSAKIQGQGQTAVSGQAGLICSRDAFGFNLGRRLAEWRRKGPIPTVVLVRIDHYAEMVRYYGPKLGDLLLQSIRQFLIASIREMDIAGEHGEATFSMMLPGAGMPSLLRVAERLRMAVSHCVLPMNDVSLQFTVSVACAVAIADDNTEGLVRRTEKALEAAVACGGNCTFFHNGLEVKPAASAMETSISS
jgi:diguanylate cyclase